MKKFFSRFNTQIFIESLDLSNNFELNEDLAQFIIKFYNQYNLAHDTNFNFMDQLHLEKLEHGSRVPKNAKHELMVKNAHDFEINKLKYKKNLILVDVSLRNCTINYHSLNVISRLLKKNSNFRLRQHTALSKVEYHVRCLESPHLRSI